MKELDLMPMTGYLKTKTIYLTMKSTQESIVANVKAFSTII